MINFINVPRIQSLLRGARSLQNLLRSGLCDGRNLPSQIKMRLTCLPKLVGDQSLCPQYVLAPLHCKDRQVRHAGRQAPD